MDAVDEYFRSYTEASGPNLIEAGILDSIGLFDFIVFLEDRLKIQIDAAEISEENFKNLVSIRRFVAVKVAEMSDLE